ncbi:MAG: helix-turn-helix transcriptional regulator [Pseudomonadota bacterium]
MLLMLEAPFEKQAAIARRARSLRISLNIQQKELSEKSGVPLPTLRKFEQTGVISLNALIRIAMALGALGDFDRIFEEREIRTIAELEARENSPKRKRVRKSRL